MSAYISRVSNESILRTARQPRLSATLLQRQLVLLGKVARQPCDHPMRKYTFVDGTLRPKTEMYVQKVGRLRDLWAKQLLKEGVKLAGGKFELQRAILDEAAWNSLVSRVTLL